MNQSENMDQRHQRQTVSALKRIIHEQREERTRREVRYQRLKAAALDVLLAWEGVPPGGVTEEFLDALAVLKIRIGKSALAAAETSQLCNLADAAVERQIIEDLQRQALSGEDSQVMPETQV